MNLKKMIFYITIVVSTLLIVSVVSSVSEAKSYKSSFSNRSLRSKFGLSGSGFEWVAKAQKRFEKAKKRDYKILRQMMKENGNWR